MNNKKDFKKSFIYRTMLSVLWKNLIKMFTGYYEDT